MEYLSERSGNRLKDDLLKPTEHNSPIPYTELAHSEARTWTTRETKLREELFTRVAFLSSVLMEGLDELIEWKDDVVTLEALPTNVLAKLGVVCSKITRSKGSLRFDLLSLLTIAKELSSGLIYETELKTVNEELEKKSIALDLAKMREIELQRKHDSSSAQVIRLQCQHRLFRWHRLSSRVRENELENKVQDLQSSLLKVNEENEELRKNADVLQQELLYKSESQASSIHHRSSYQSTYRRSSRTSSTALQATLERASDGRNSSCYKDLIESNRKRLSSALISPRRISNVHSTTKRGSIIVNHQHNQVQEDGNSSDSSEGAAASSSSQQPVEPSSSRSTSNSSVTRHEKLVRSSESSSQLRWKKKLEKLRQERQSAVPSNIKLETQALFSMDTNDDAGTRTALEKLVIE